jgi:hypothetical protein
MLQAELETEADLQRRSDASGTRTPGALESLALEKVCKLSSLMKAYCSLISSNSNNNPDGINSLESISLPSSTDGLGALMAKIRDTEISMGPGSLYEEVLPPIFVSAITRPDSGLDECEYVPSLLKMGRIPSGSNDTSTGNSSDRRTSGLSLPSSSEYVLEFRFVSALEEVVSASSERVLAPSAPETEFFVAMPDLSRIDEGFEDAINVPREAEVPRVGYIMRNLSREAILRTENQYQAGNIERIFERTEQGEGPTYFDSLYDYAGRLLDFFNCTTIERLF